MKTPYLESGTTGFTDENGKWICTGSQMGRRTIIPDEYNGERLHLRYVPFVDACYDPGGAYWGIPADLYCAWGETETDPLQIFTRARSRKAAKAAIMEEMNLRCAKTPKFYR